jgi:nucleoside-diphosphate-sugar epimerase
VSGGALVVGAGGALGEAIVRELASNGWQVTASMRALNAPPRTRLAALGVELVRCDVLTDELWPSLATGRDVIIFASRLEISLAALKRLAQAPQRVVAFSSNNVALDPGAETYRAIQAAEIELRALAPTCAVIRPTLIYGDPRLVTVTRLMRWARGLCMPLPGHGRALMQPVFHEDLARIAAGLAAAEAPSGVFAAGGPDVLSMRALYEAVRHAANGNALIAPIPAALLKMLAPLSGGVFSVEQAARADQDRIAVAQDALPAALEPRTPLSEGLAHLRQLMASEAQSGG